MAKIFGVHVPSELNNLAINGGFDFWQEKAGTTTTINTATSSFTYAADMWAVSSSGATVKNYNYLRSSSTVPTLAQSGFNSRYSMQFQVLTAIGSLAASDEILPYNYFMEGQDYARIHSKKVTFGFWFNASVAGTYSFAMQNNAGNRSYVTTFTQNSGGVWEYKTITVTLDNTGTWLFDTNFGLAVYIAAVSGSTGSTSTLGSWQNGAFVAATGATNYFATINATLNLAQFSIVEGPIGLGPTGFVRSGKTIEAEFASCQRYYEKTYQLDDIPGTVTANGQAQTGQPNNANWQWTHYFNTTKRTRGYTTLIYDPVAGTSSHVHNTTAGSLTAASNGGETNLATFTCSQAPGASNTLIQYHATFDDRF